MKRLFLFVAVATLGLMASCSGDDNGEGSASVLKVTINGVPKTFNTIDVNSHDVSRTITASINNNPSEIIVFDVMIGRTGSDATSYFRYIKDGTEYNTYNLTDIVQVNNNGKLKGTFIGKVVYEYYSDSDELITEEVNLTDGSFDISY